MANVISMIYLQVATNMR